MKSVIIGGPHRVNTLTGEGLSGVVAGSQVVGTDRLLESSYFRAKMAQEELIQSSSIPYTIVHATQFFEFTSLGTVHPNPPSRSAMKPSTETLIE